METLEERFPFLFNTQADYNTNSQSYYDGLAKYNKLLQILAKMIEEYDETLNSSLENINTVLTNYTNMLDGKLAGFDDSVMLLLREWIDDGTFEMIINTEIFNHKLDTTVFNTYKENADSVALSFSQQLEHKINIVNYSDLAIETPLGLDWTPAINKAISDISIKNGGVIVFPQGTFLVTDTIILPANKQITLQGQGTHHDGSVTRTTEIEFNHLETGIQILGQGSKIEGISTTRLVPVPSSVVDILVESSYTVLDELNVSVNGGIGVSYDGNTHGCFFNELNRTNITGYGIMLEYTGLKCTTNRSFGGKIRSLTTGGLLIHESATQNTFISVNFEGNTDGYGINAVSGANTFLRCHVENNNVGITTSRYNIFIGTVPVSYEGQTAWEGTGSKLATVLGRKDVEGAFDNNLQIPGFKFGSTVFDTGVTSHIDPTIINPDSYFNLNLFSKTKSLGNKSFTLSNWNGTEFDNMFSVKSTPSKEVTRFGLGNNVTLLKSSLNPVNEETYSKASPGSLAVISRTGYRYTSTGIRYGQLFFKTRGDDNAEHWKEIQVIHSGLTTERPREAPIGFQYFDTELNKPIWKSDTTWVDSNGVNV